jgi:hypothetical protein
MKIPKTDVNNFYNGQAGQLQRGNCGQLRRDCGCRCISDYLFTKLTTKAIANANIKLALFGF